MTIAIDAASANQPRRTGPASYAHHVIRALQSVGLPGTDVTLLTEQPLNELPSRLPGSWHSRVLAWPGRGWSGVRLPLHLAVAGYDVFWQPTHSLVYLPRKTRGVMTVHDVAFFEAPQVYGAYGQLRQRLFLRWGRMFLGRCITVSEYTKQQLVERAGLRADRITVTPLAADEGMAPQPPDEVSKVLARHGVRAPYLISAGRIEKKKGIVEIVEALVQLPADVQLVLCGRDGYGSGEVHRRVVELGLAERVKFVGWVSDQDLASLLSGAVCYVSACRYEGFGIAVLDALACGCPVVAYRAGAVPETVGEAAVLVEPVGASALVEAIGRVITDSSLTEQLRTAGLKRAVQFSWAETARQTWVAIDRRY